MQEVSAPHAITLVAEDIGKTLGGIHTLWGVIENLITDTLPCHIDLVVYTTLFDAMGSFIIHHEVQDEEGRCIERLPDNEVVLTMAHKHIIVTDLQGLTHATIGKFRIATLCRPADKLDSDPVVIAYYPYRVFLRSVK